MAIITSVTKIICSDTLAAFFRPIYENHVFREEFHYGLGILKLIKMDESEFAAEVVCY